MLLTHCEETEHTEKDSAWDEVLGRDLLMLLVHNGVDLLSLASVSSGMKSTVRDGSRMAGKKEG
jgi:hypothetical protein